MKIRNNALLILLLFTALLSSCKFELIQEVDEVAELELGIPGEIANGISDETLLSIPIDLGEIGVAVDTRILAIRAYKPSKINFNIEGSLSAYSQVDIPVDEFTHVANFTIKRKDLSDAELKGFSNGVPINVTVYNEVGDLIDSRTVSRYIINSTNRTLKIDNNLPYILKPLSLNPDIPYFIQTAADTEFKTLGISSDYEGFTGSELGLLSGKYQFYFEKTANYERDFTYKIKLNTYTWDNVDYGYLDADVYNTYGNNGGNNGENIAVGWGVEGATNNRMLIGESDFLLEQTNNGTVKIRLFSSESYLSTNGDPFETGYKIFFDTNPTNDLEFNIFADNISWKFDDLGTKYSPAIIPPTKMDFAFDQTIINCSGATGDYEVGIATTVSKTTSISYEESINLFSSKFDFEEATVEASAEASFFGIGASVSASGTLRTETTTEWGKEKKTNQGIEYEESQEVSANRKVTVLPYSAIEVFDVIQKLKNVSIPFVQRFIIRGSVNDENYLTGPEIEAQLFSNHFRGVVTEVGSDFIVISIRGAVNVTNYFEYNNNLHDIEGACN